MLNNNRLTSTCEKAVLYFDNKPQLNKVVEELTELSLEIQHFLNKNKDNREDILSEIADVYIMLEQLNIIFMFEEKDIIKAIDNKLNKIEKKLNKYDNV